MLFPSRYNSFLALVVAVFVGTTSGFLNDAVANSGAIVGLKKLSNAQGGTVLDISLDVGKDKDARMSISGLKFELLEDDKPKTNNGAPPFFMPGIHGHRPELSSGSKCMEVHDGGHFVDFTGKKSVRLGEDACWEFCWRHDSPAGTIVCGIELPEALKRNRAALDAGKMYLGFTVWTQDTLAEYRDRKDQVERMARRYLAEKEEELAKMQTTGNVLKKMLHYRNAFAAAEKYSLTPRSAMSRIPGPDDVMTIGEGLLMSTRGEVWTQSGTGFYANKQIPLGTATIRPPSLQGLMP